MISPTGSGSATISLESLRHRVDRPRAVSVSRSTNAASWPRRAPRRRPRAFAASSALRVAADRGRHALQCEVLRVCRRARDDRARAARALRRRAACRRRRRRCVPGRVREVVHDAILARPVGDPETLSGRGANAAWPADSARRASASRRRSACRAGSRRRRAARRGRRSRRRRCALIRSSSATGSRIARSDTSRITLPLSVVKPIRHAGWPPSLTSSRAT